MTTRARGFTPDSNNYTSATGSGSLTVNQAAPTVALASSANPALVSTSVTLTATVSSSASTHRLGQLLRRHDAAWFGHTGFRRRDIREVKLNHRYAFDHCRLCRRFQPFFCNKFSRIAVCLRSDCWRRQWRQHHSYSLGGWNRNLSSDNLPVDGLDLPRRSDARSKRRADGINITITPQTIAAGATATNVTVAVQVPVASAAVRNSNFWLLGFGLPLMGMFALPIGIEGRRLSAKRMLVALLLLIIVVSTGAILGCGNSSTSAPPPHQPTNYTITVTATSGAVPHSTALTLTVQ